MTTTTTVSSVSGTVTANEPVRRGRKPKHSVKWLERELAEARRDLQAAVERIDAINIDLAQKSEELTLRITQRDALMDQRDGLMRLKDAILRVAKDDCQSHRRFEDTLRLELRRANDSNSELTEQVKYSFDSAHRNADVAAVLASIVVEAVGTPTEAMRRITQAVIEMGVSPDIVNEVRIALKRGFVAEIDRVSEILELATENSAGVLTEEVQ